MSKPYWVFQHKVTNKYHRSLGDTSNPEMASPKFGSGESAFGYADEHYEGQPEAKMRFRANYEIAVIS